MKFNRLKKSLIPISLVAAQALFGAACVVDNGTGGGDVYKEIDSTESSCTISSGFLDGVGSNLRLDMIVSEVTTASNDITIANPLYLILHPDEENSVLNINHTDFQTSTIDVDDDTATININADFTTGGEIGKNGLHGEDSWGTLTINVDQEATFTAQHNVKANINVYGEETVLNQSVAFDDALKIYFDDGAIWQIEDAGHDITYITLDSGKNFEQDGLLTITSTQAFPDGNITLVDAATNGGALSVNCDDITLAGTLSAGKCVVADDKLIIAKNNLPVVESDPIETATEDSPYSYSLTGNDVDGDDLNWSVVNKPEWLTLETSNDWKEVGSTEFSAGLMSFTSILINSANIPYIVYADNKNDGKATVMKYNGSTWEEVGMAGFSAGSVNDISIAFDSNDTPYVVYKDFGNDAKATVMKYNGSTWEEVGTAGFSAGAVGYTSIAFDSNDTPYVVYKDFNSGNNGITVMRYNNSSWEEVGTTGFSTGAVGYTSIAFDSNDAPYVVFRDYGNDSKAVVMKYNTDNSNWEEIGTNGFSAGAVGYTSIAIDSNNIPYVVYIDGDINDKATVMRYNNSSWEEVGTAGFSAGSVDYTEIAIDSNNIPYVVYKDVDNNDKATVMKYEDSAWVEVQSTGSSAGSGNYTSIAIDSNNIPYVVYVAYQEIDTKATVMKFNTENISGTPTNADVGVHDVNLTLSDGFGEVAHNFQITVGNVNDAPTSANINLTIDEDETKTFALNDFNFTDDDTIHGDTLEAIYVTSLPTKGELKVNGIEVEENQQITAYDISNLTYTPASSESGASYSSFDFKVNDGDLNSTASYSVNFNVDVVNDKPELQSELIITTPKDTPFTQELVSSDEENDTISWSVLDGKELPKWLNLELVSKEFTDWVSVGSEGFSNEGSEYSSIAIDSNNTIYVAFMDAQNDAKATVKKFDGTQWIDVGTPGISEGRAIDIQLKIDSQGIPYVAYNDIHNRSIVLKRFVNNTWEDVSSDDIGGENSSFGFTLDSDDVPYIVYYTDTTIDGEERDEITIKIYESAGGEWGTFKSWDEADVNDPVIAIDKQNTIYVAYIDENDQGVLKRVSKTTIETVGGLLGNEVSSESISMDFMYVGDNVFPLVAYIEEDTASGDDEAKVQMFNGMQWSELSTDALQSSAGGGIAVIDIVVDENQIPYVAYTNGGYAKARVQRFVDGVWEYVVSEDVSKDFSKRSARDLSIALDTSGTPVVVYSDGEYDESLSAKRLASEVAYKLSGTPTVPGQYDVDLVLSDGYNDVEYSYSIIVAADISITPSISKGTTNTATKITYTPASGNKLKYMFSNSSVTTPNYGDSTSDILGLVDYTSGTNLEDAKEGQYLAVYEVDSNGNIVGFYQEQLEANDIYSVDEPVVETPLPKLIASMPDQLVDINDTQKFDFNVTGYFENVKNYEFEEVKSDHNISDWLYMHSGTGVLTVRDGYDHNASLLTPGKYYIQVNGYDSDDNHAKGYFTLRVKNLAAGLSEYITKPNDAKETKGDDFLSFAKDDSNATVYNDGSAKHSISGVAEAESKLPDSKVTISDNGDVNTSTSTINNDGQIVDIEVLGKVNDSDGIKAEHSLTLEDGNVTKATSKVPNTKTTIRTDRVVETNATVGSNSISVLAQPDGKASHSVIRNGKTSKANVDLPGAQTTIDETGEVDTKLPISLNSNGCAGSYYAEVVTDSEGNNITKFRNDDENCYKAPTLKEGEEFPIGSESNITQIGGSIHIQTTTPVLDGATTFGIE